MNKIGLHIIGGYSGPLGVPRAVKLVDVPASYVKKVRAQVGPEAIILVRWAEAAQLLDDPAARAREWFARHEAAMRAMAEGGLPVTFEGYSDVDLGLPELEERARAYAAFEVERLRLMHEAGLASVVGNFRSGQPHEGLWPSLQPMLAAMQPGDLLGLHEYWQSAAELDDRRVAGRWALPAVVALLARVPIVVSECGRAGGWLASLKAEEYLEELARYNAILEGSANVLAATVFTVGGEGHDSDQVGEIWPQVVARYTPAPVEGDDLAYMLRNGAWNAGGIAYNPDAAFPSYARELGLGNPETPEFDFCFQGAWYRGQGFSRGIVYAPIGKWGECDFLPW